MLGTIPGYRVHLELDEVASMLDHCGYVHIVADERWAPLDAQLFRFRQQVGAQTLAPFVIASLLAKKLAAGVVRAGFDIRVGPHGNFGVNLGEARQNARRLVSTAALLGIDATCVLTDAGVPYQPFIGRSEALLALALVFEDNAPSALHRHLELCERMSMAASGSQLPAAVEGPVLFDHFAANLEAQGSSLKAFAGRVGTARRAARVTIDAREDGYIGFELAGFRQILVDAQRSAGRGEEFPDPAGVLLLKFHGEEVSEGESVAEVRADSKREAAVLAARLRSWIRTYAEPLAPAFEPEVVGRG